MKSVFLIFFCLVIIIIYYQYFYTIKEGWAFSATGSNEFDVSLEKDMMKFLHTSYSIVVSPVGPLNIDKMYAGDFMAVTNSNDIIKITFSGTIIPATIGNLLYMPIEELMKKYPGIIKNPQSYDALISLIVSCNNLDATSMFFAQKANFQVPASCTGIMISIISSLTFFYNNLQTPDPTGINITNNSSGGGGSSSGLPPSS